MKKTIPFLSIGIAIFLSIVFIGAISTSSRAAGPYRGYVVIQPDPHRRWIRDISFSSNINGIEALELAGQEVVTTSTAFGVAVCSINGVGCPPDNCFCSSSFWDYSYWDGSAWQSHPTGAGGSSLGDRAVEGWRWGEWGVGSLPPANHLIAANEALDYLLAQQSADGGYGSASSSVETLLSIGANHITPADWRKANNPYSLSNYLLLKGAAFTKGGSASAGKLSVGLSGSQGCQPYRSQSPSGNYDSATGIYAEGAGNQSWAMLGVSAISETIPAQAVSYLKSLQKSDGSFEWGTGYGYDTNSTSLAIQALIAGGESITSTAVISGLNYLQSAQNSDGGFPYDPVSVWGTASDANSTAYAIQAIIAAGQDPQASPWVQSGSDPIQFLLSLQLPDGSFEWQKGGGVNFLATQQAIPALLHRPFPLNEAPWMSCPANSLPVIIFSNPN